MSNTLVASNFPVLSPLGSLDAYVNAVHQIPMLTQAEEQNLARRFLGESDLDAAK
ncbi:MAG: sigma-70 factor domain-containing protein, partial [Dokdonella sp.]